MLEMPAATRRATRTAANILTATPAEAALIIACALADPRDLLALAIAVPPRFANKCIAAPPPHRRSASGTAAATQQTELWSIIQEAARRWTATCTDQERGWVPRRGRESWLGLMWEVQMLRRGAVFGRSHESITLSEGGSLATIPIDANGGSIRTAASKAVMRAGHHYAQFTVMSGFLMNFGVIRPGWDVEGGEDAQFVDGHCFYYAGYGYRWPGFHDWEGMQTARDEGDRIGMLLDLDQGTMTVYKNDERLGVMATGLSGEYSWAVVLYGGQAGNRVRIEAVEAPASPTSTESA
eukprot:COSAG06_NODE_933_length_11441_cov_12.056075_4_plen_295_part_00